ncbi:MAG: TonB-dependent receptor, partial [Acidobacteriota bacterium]|nr:TonB-dependent receptor [Acidobacteriota bacterium]
MRASKAGFEDSSTTVQIGREPFVELVITLNPQIKRTSIDVADTPPPVEQSSSQNYELHPAEVKNLPSNPATVGDALPLVPGVTRAQNGELRIDGMGEQRSSLVVNQSDVTDPATGKFGQTVPVDSIESVNVLNTPFLAQYGRFTQSVVAVETRRGGDKWHADLNDPFPDVRVRSYHIRGIRNETPRGVIGGPLIPNRLYLITALQYFLDKTPSRTLPFPRNESKQERVNSFSQLDYIASPRQIVNFTFHFSPEHINFVDPDYFNPQPVTPSYAQRNYVATLADHFGIFGGTLDSSLSMQRFHTFIGAQGGDDMVLTPDGNRGNYFGAQSRDAWRREWLEIWSPSPLHVWGTHQFKIGTSLTVVNDRGFYAFRSVNILDAAGQRLERIDFTNQAPYKRTDLEFTLYGQDHWTVTPKLSFDYGLRVEHQRLASSLRIAPRAGLAWTPFLNGRTVVRLGYGEFYDHIPTDVYAFSRYPIRTVTSYAPDGGMAGAPTAFANVIGSATGPRSFLINGQRVAGAFSPRGSTWNAQVEHS